MDLSVVIPTYNEEGNVSLLCKAINDALRKEKIKYEILFVDDGSTDNTLSKLRSLQKKDKRIRIVQFRKNFGQTAAMDAGFKQAKGKVIVPMDADLQNDPADIPRLLKKLRQGYDVVSGWRKHRQDSVQKKLFSRFADLLRKLVFNDSIHDSGCTLKAYKKKCFAGLALYGEMHRFIPAILQMRGFKIGELVVKHHHRKHGDTKYGLIRTFKGFLDMIVVKFWMEYSVRPMHIFGGAGIVTGILGVLIMIYLAYIRLFLGWGIGNRPLLTLGVLLLVLATQFIIFGVLADILIKVYYKNETTYTIEKVY